jgi:TctA family transporter
LAYEASPDWWLWLGIGLTTLITAGLAWYVARNANLKAADVVALALPVSLFIAPYAWAYEHALLLIPITMIYQHMRRSRVAHLLWLGLTIFLPWLLFSLALKRGVDTASFLLPLVTAGLFLITLRPARGIPAVDKAAISP